MSEEDAEPEFRSGDKVRVVGMNPAYDYLNGKTGFIRLREDGKQNRHYVELEIEGSNGEKKLKEYGLKRRNLEPVECNRSKPMLLSASGSPVSQEASDSSGFDGMELFDAVQDGNVEVVRDMIEILSKVLIPDHPRPADAFVDEDGDTMLYHAVTQGYKAVLEVLLEYGADPNVKIAPADPEMRNRDLTMLQKAIWKIGFNSKKDSRKKGQERADIVFLLIEAGADVNRVSSRTGPLLLYIMSPLLPAKHWELRMRLLKALLAKGAVPSVFQFEMSGSIDSPLARACVGAYCYFGSKERQLEAVQLLLDHGADPGAMVSAPGAPGQMAVIHLVTHCSLFWVLEVLLKSEKGRAAVNKRTTNAHDLNQDGHTPIYSAILCNKLLESKEYNDLRKCVALLLQYGADVNIPDARGYTPYSFLRNSTDPKVQELCRLVDKAPPARNKKAVATYWSSSEVDAWVGKGSDRRCVVCYVLPESDEDTRDMKVCSACMIPCYCSQNCQAIHWPIHQKECKKK